MIELYILDTETNGIKCGYHEINEISVIRYKDRVQLTEFIKCEHPEKSSFDALRITNKTLADLAKGNSKEAAIKKLNTFFEEDGLTPAHRCIIAHNASFDRRFIHALYEEVNQAFPANLWLCTMALTRKFLKQAGIKSKVNLHASCDVVGIKKFADRHASKVDTRNTYLLYKALIEDKNIDHLPLIKTIPHELDISESELDPDLLDL